MFTKETDRKIKTAVLGGLGSVLVLGLVAYFGMRNYITDVGYRPEQPVPFSHKLHAGELKVSCQYCHTGVENSAHSPIPSTSTCMNCHIAVKTDSPKLQKVRDSWEKGTPIEWRRIHYVPDYVNFPHNRHIRAQIDCRSCHGPVENMGVISQYKSLSMGWCLDCHRNPEQHIVPARPISGIFTGQMIENLDTNKLFIPTSREVQLAKFSPIIKPEYGQWYSEVSKPVMENVPSPKKPGRGPENCSACHY